MNKTLTKIALGLVATGLALGVGLVAIGGNAHASEIACQVADGCGTLHGTDAAGIPVALDAKRKADLGIDIGYPDLPNDQATAWSLVLHQGHGRVTYTDLTDTPAGTGIDGLTASVAAGSLTFTYEGNGTSAYSIGLSGFPELPASLALANTIAEPDIYTVSTAVPAYLRPGTYNVAIVLTSQDPAVEGTTPPPVFTDGTLTLTVTGTVVFVPAQPYYSLAYVTPQGNWTSDCATVLGDGLMRNEPCTLGRDPTQMFRFYQVNAGVVGTVPVVVPLASSAQPYAVMNTMTGKYLEDQSGLSASQLLIPQSDAGDALAFTGRQLDALGPATAVWSFGS